MYLCLRRLSLTQGAREELLLTGPNPGAGGNEHIPLQGIGPHGGHGDPGSGHQDQPVQKPTTATSSESKQPVQHPQTGIPFNEQSQGHLPKMRPSSGIHGNVKRVKAVFKDLD